MLFVDNVLASWQPEFQKKFTRSRPKHCEHKTTMENSQSNTKEITVNPIYQNSDKIFYCISVSEYFSISKHKHIQLIQSVFAKNFSFNLI